VRADADLLVCIVPNGIEVLEEDITEKPLFAAHVLYPDHALSKANRV